jgi:hypothetical protein
VSIRLLSLQMVEGYANLQSNISIGNVVNIIYLDRLVNATLQPNDG